MQYFCCCCDPLCRDCIFFLHQKNIYAGWFFLNGQNAKRPTSRPKALLDWGFHGTAALVGCQQFSMIWDASKNIYGVYPKPIPKRGVVQFCQRALIEKIDVWISSNNSCPSVSRRATIFHYSEWCPPSTKQYHARHHMIFHFPLSEESTHNQR